MKQRIKPLFLTTSLLLALLQSSVQAQTGTVVTEPEGTITIEQESPLGIFGRWTLLDQQKRREEGDMQSFSFYHRPTGVYTLFVEPPKGAMAAVKIFLNEEFHSHVPRPQASITVKEGEHYRLLIIYTFSRVGQVIVRSDPPGVAFTLEGPNNLSLSAVTPVSYPESPEGQYTVRFHLIKGCTTPPPKSLLLQKDSRASFTVTLTCPWADERRAALQQEIGGKEEKPVMVTIDGQAVTLRDVPQSAWFAPHVFNMVKVGVLSGYRDAAGNPTGEFGPGNTVTVAELAKMAHRVAGLNEMQSGTGEVLRRRPPPNNSRAQGQWFSDYIASTEERAWTIYEDGSIDPLRPATRGEVIVTLLQALDIPVRWQKGEMFKDVTLRTPQSNAIETAAQDGIIGGYTDAEGNPTGFFGPEDPVKRAEMAKILDLAIDTYRTPSE